MKRSLLRAAAVLCALALAGTAAMAQPPDLQLSPGAKEAHPTMPEKLTLQQYLAADLARGVIDHRLRTQREADGAISFYVHPANTDGQMPTYRVDGNRLVQMHTAQVLQADPAPQSTAPRVTPQDVEDAIASEYFHLVPGTTVTLCVLTLANGYNVVGQSACVSPENFSAEICRQVARQDASRRIWDLLGYALRERLQAAQDQLAA